MDLKIPLPVPQGKATSTHDEQPKRRKHEDGLVGLVNIGNSCYMNATLQALSNCPPFRQYFLDCHHPTTSSGQTQKASDSLSVVLRKIWASERPPGHLSPRLVSSAMKNKMFRGTLQQDAQEFLRCLLTQIHDEIAITVPPPQPFFSEGVASQKSCDSTTAGCHRDSMISSASHDSECSSSSGDSNSKLVASARNSPLQTRKKCSSSSPRQKAAAGVVPSSPANQPKFQFSLRGSYSKIRGAKGSTESLESRRPASLKPPPTGLPPSTVTDCHAQREGKEEETEEEEEEGRRARLRWSEGDVFVVDMITRQVAIHGNCSPTGTSPTLESSATGDHDSGGKGESKPERKETCWASPVALDDTVDVNPQGLQAVENEGREMKEEGEGEERRKPSLGRLSPEEGGEVPPQQAISLRENEKKKSVKPQTRSIVSEVFEGTLESRVKCLTCKKVSVTREPFQDLSLPIPGRKEMAKYSQREVGGAEERGEEAGKGALSRGFCTVWNFVTTLTKDILVGPPTNLHDCLDAFFDTSELKGDNRYYCSHCKSFQNSQKEMNIVKLPEVLSVHLKRFRFDAYFSSKISRHIAFPLTGLDLSEYLKEGPKCSGGHHYDLSAVITHYGGAGGGHYVAFAKNVPRNSWYEFNDTRVLSVSTETVMAAEGYVLFYRRLAPSDSQASQAFDHSVLLPRPGTRVPSPDICYISRHWLHLFKHCADPGPIFQYEFACRHGGLLPTKAAADARSASLLIRKEIWELLQQSYGGGPMVQRLEVCQTCQAHLQHLTERRRSEKDAIHQLQTEEHNLTERKAEPYLLSIEWLQQWQKFIHSSTLDVGPPGPVDNSRLLRVGVKSEVSLVDGASFRKLSHATWSYFISTYGGGPTIVTSLELTQKL